MIKWNFPTNFEENGKYTKIQTLDKDNALKGGGCKIIVEKASETSK